MSYTHIQCIAYRMSTLHAFTTSAKTPSEDALLRMRMVYDVMKYCAERLKGDQPTTLKIFVAPEFYGLSSQADTEKGTGHYSLEDVWKGFEALKELCKKDKGFQHWLVVPGTFAAADTTKQEKPLVFNSLYAFTGDGELSRILHKKNLPSTERSESWLIGNSRLYKDLTSRTPTRPSALFKVDNLNIGIEICYDHNKARLKNSLMKKEDPQKKGDPLPTSKGVDVHILTACFMEIEASAIATKDNGYFFRVDGYANTQTPVECRTIKWQNATIDGKFKSTSNKPLSTYPLPQKLQIKSAYDPLDIGNDNFSICTIYDVLLI